MIKIIICGSRGFRDLSLVEQKVINLQADCDYVLMTGNARGVDQAAEHQAYISGVYNLQFPADWDKHGKAAGIIRNIEMLDHIPDKVIAFWDGKSPGTKHMIEQSLKRKINLEVIF